MSQMIDIKAETAKVLKKANLWKWGGGLAAVLILGPIMWFLAWALLGVAAAGIMALVVGALALGVVNYLPVYTMKLANHKIELIKAEARRRPIETMQNLYAEKKAALEAALEKIKKFGTKVASHQAKLATFKAQFPNDAAQFEQTHQKMVQLYQVRQQKWKESNAKLEDFANQIEKATSIWEMALASAELTEAAGDLEDTVMQRIQRETAFQAVQDGLSASMVELDTLLMQEIDISVPASPVLTNSASVTLEPIELITDVRQFDRVQRGDHS